MQVFTFIPHLIHLFVTTFLYRIVQGDATGERFLVSDNVSSQEITEQGGSHIPETGPGSTFVPPSTGKCTEDEESGESDENTETGGSTEFE
jgi:hypothetical protein